MVAAALEPTRLGFTARMRRLAALPLLVLAAALPGCTTAGTSSSSKKFSGAAGDVADAVGDLGSAGRSSDAGKLCTQLLARSLVTRLESSGSSCTQELDKALDDVSDFTLDVRDVKVDGTQATATVREGDSGPTRRIEFVREADRWKASGFSTG